MADASCQGIISNPDLVGIGVSPALHATPVRLFVDLTG
jgi:hypothetical protein